MNLSLVDIIGRSLTMGRTRNEKSPLNSKRGSEMQTKEHLIRSQEMWV